MRRRIIAASLSGWALVLYGCAHDPAVHDTGYQGTWSRGSDWITSLAAIVREGDGYRFRVAKRSADGKLKTVCDWDGNCVETKEGKKVAEIRYRWWVDASSGHLFTAYDEKRFDQREGPSAMTQTDELVVQPGGLEIMALTRERNGQKFEGATPKRVFRKVGDSVAYPPGVVYRD